MFFKKKSQKSNLLDELSLELKRQGEAIQKSSEAQAQKQELQWASFQSLAERLADGQAELKKTFRRQMGSYEDMLQELEEISGRLEELKKKQDEREQALAQTAALCTEQLGMLERELSRGGAFAGTEQAGAWSKQFAMMRKARMQAECLAGLSEIGQAGEAFQYQLHETVSTVETAEEQQAGTVAEVFSPGMVYDGKVLKKAQVSVYRRTENVR